MFYLDFKMEFIFKIENMIWFENENWKYDLFLKLILILGFGFGMGMGLGIVSRETILGWEMGELTFLMFLTFWRIKNLRFTI